MSDDPRNDHAGLTIPDVIAATMTSFVPFARAHLMAPRPPVMAIAVWLIGMEAVAGAVELERMRPDVLVVSNWFHVWLRIMAGGVFVGVVRYWMVGSLFHVAASLAGTREPARTSRYVFLYALVPASVINLSSKVAEMLLYRNEYFTSRQGGPADMVFVGITLGAYLFSLRLCYLGMRDVLGCNPARSKLVLAAIVAGMMLLALLLNQWSVSP